MPYSRSFFAVARTGAFVFAFCRIEVVTQGQFNLSVVEYVGLYQLHLLVVEQIAFDGSKQVVCFQFYTKPFIEKRLGNTGIYDKLILGKIYILIVSFALESHIESE